MSNITCPKCGEVFQIDESGYQEIVRQVRNDELEREVSKRVELQKAQDKIEAQQAIERERGQADEKAKKLETKIAELQAQLESQQKIAESDLKAGVAEERDKLQREMAEKDAAIAKLSEQLKGLEGRAEAERELAVQEATQVLKEQHERALKEQLQEKEDQIKECELEIARVRDWRAKLSVKMLGESLEKHCEQEFEKLRATAFRNAQFYKDTDKAPGSMGDYIFRDLDAEGNEIVSIMFDMKTEQDVSQNKKKNTDHLDKLSKDRVKKGCEYAVLVSTLEEDNEFYNTGIADVSYLCGHPKTYVVRPQFFIPIITLLRNAAEGSLEYKRELAQLRAQDIDVTNFENKWIKFQESFNNSCRLAGERYADALTQIDNAIKNLEKLRESLKLSDGHLSQANKKAQEMTIRKLTYGNPTMKAKFDEARALNAAQEERPE